MLLLLDIDGVMVQAKSWTSPTILSDGFSAFSLQATKTLKKLLSNEDVTVILTTSHKNRYSIEEWKELFFHRGINILKLDKLPEFKIGRNRKEEILNWVNTTVVNEDFVIIDDDSSLNDLPPQLKKHLVLTSPIIGLTENHLTEIKTILKGSVHNL